jgi:hypothetical protein
MSGSAASQPNFKADSYTKWQLTIPAGKEIRIKTAFGVFNVPIGYLTSRLSFRQNPFAAHNNVARYDALQAQEWTSFAFNYWVPDGGMVWHSQPQVKANRPIEPGHLVRSREAFVVKMHGMNILGERLPRQPDMSALPERLDVVLPARPLFPDGSAYVGATREGDTDNYLRFSVECRPGMEICEGWFVIDRRKMVLWTLVPRDASDFLFDAVKGAAGLIDSWEERGRSPN